MNDKIANKAFEYVDAIAQKLGVAAEHVYPILIKNQIIDGVTGLLFGIVLLVLSWLAAKKGFVLNRNFDTELAGGLMMLFGGLATIAGLCMVFFNIGPIINPEYYAIKDIASFINGN